MSAPSSGFASGSRTRIRRRDRREEAPEAALAVIDEALICHVAFGPAPEPSPQHCPPPQYSPPPQCLPMAHARVGETIYLHGACSNRMLRALVGNACSMTFTLIDGLVFARSAFHHSMNYRCVVVIGLAVLVEDLDEKRAALRAIVEHAAPGRADECVAMTDSELKATQVLAVHVQEAACKVRRGPPVDDSEHVAQQAHFAGALPLQLRASPVERDPLLQQPLAIPPSLQACVGRFGGLAPVEQTLDGVLYSSDSSRIDWPWVHRYLRDESYWAAGVTLNELRTSLEHSITFGAFTGGQQVAFARVLTDRARIAYLADVFVDASFRGRGCGKRIVEFALAHPAVAGCARVLLGTRDAAGLYEQCGFNVTSNRAMVRLRT